MKPGEEELQKKIESGHPADGLDARAYEAVFRALKKEPVHQLPDDFADRVVRRVTAGRTPWPNDYFWLGAGILFLLIACVGTILFTGYRFDFGFLNVMGHYKGIVGFGLALIVLLNWLDKKLIKEKALRHKF